MYTHTLCRNVSFGIIGMAIGFSIAASAAAQKDAQVAFAYRNYIPASTAIKILSFRGPIMVTAQGMTVYVQTRNHNQFGGREVRGGHRYDYSEAKAVGTQGCVKECLKTWKLVAAPANARASRFGETDTRADGTRQWAYKRAAIYTYEADTSVGDNKGNNLHEAVYRNGKNEDIVNLSRGDTNGVAGAGFYWHVVPLFN
jgi:predicted lipoprotein with Yx(FWY)xxD motif